jgi:ABC-type lipoprotein export system ATPase subunit
VLELREISKSFRGPEGRVQAVSNVSLKVESGEFVAVQGPSGSGKSTLLLIAGGLLYPDEGSVFIDGSNPYELRQNSRSALRAGEIGFVFQQFHLVPYLTVLQNVLAASVAKPQGGEPDRAKELLRHMNLEHRMQHVPAQLSTGEQQRTALARALLNDPKLILADEPTGNLDEESGGVVLESLARLAGEGKAVLMVGHDGRAGTFADRIHDLRNGRFSEGDKTEEPAMRV